MHAKLGSAEEALQAAEDHAMSGSKEPLMLEFPCKNAPTCNNTILRNSRQLATPRYVFCSVCGAAVVGQV